MGGSQQGEGRPETGVAGFGESGRQRFRLAPVAELFPGLMLASLVGIAAQWSSPLTAQFFPIPTMVVALLIGMALNASVQHNASFQSGLSFCVKALLRCAVALLGIRIALGEIIDLGIVTVVIVLASMAVTVVSGIFLARFCGREVAYGALAGAGTAVCGASATLATASVLPNYRNKEIDVAFVVVAVNALSTGAMISYPLIAAWFGFDAKTTGTLLGATIHDVAQVVGAAYSVSETTGNTAVIVKLFRVFLLLPTVLAIGYWFGASGDRQTGARLPVPLFALVFLGLSLLNSGIEQMPGWLPLYAPIKAMLVGASNWGLLIAISAVGLNTSIRAIALLGWQHVSIVIGTTVVILLAVLVGLSLTV